MRKMYIKDYKCQLKQLGSCYYRAVIKKRKYIIGIPYWVEVYSTGAYFGKDQISIDWTPFVVKNMYNYLIKQHERNEKAWEEEYKKNPSPKIWVIKNLGYILICLAAAIWVYFTWYVFI